MKECQKSSQLFEAKDERCRRILFKICIAGDWNAGKSSIILRFTEDDFLETPQETLGVEFKTKHVSVDGELVRLKLCDPGGQERFKAVTSSFYRGAHVVIFAYDCTEEDGFDNIDHWLDEAKRYSNDGIIFMLVANKVDLEAKVDPSIGKEFAKKHGIPFWEVSAKTGLNIDECFQQLAEKLLKQRLDKMRRKSREDNNRKGVDLNGEKQKKKFCFI